MQLLSLLIYNLTIRLYGAGIFVASFFNTKAGLWLSGRKNQKVPNLADKTGKRVWVHCASLGEFEQARPVIEKIKQLKPSSVIILTFFSPSGYEIRKNYAFADSVLYLPLDTASNAHHFIDQVKPDLALFVKYEFWHHYLAELKKRKIPTLLFSAIFRPQQIFFKWYGSFFRIMLRQYNKIFVQNDESKQLLANISVDSQVSFDTRFDRVNQIAQAAKTFPSIEKFKQRDRVILFGSTWPKDELLLSYLMHDAENSENLKYIVAPHNLSDEGINNLARTLETRSARLSQLTPDNATATDVMIVDTMGDLSSIYRYADIAYVGGGFNASVHNVLEPAVYGLPVIFGPNYSKSAEAKDLIQISAAFSVSNYNELETIVRKLKNDEGFKKTASLEAAQYVKSRLGGVDDIYNFVASHI